MVAQEMGAAAGLAPLSITVRPSAANPSSDERTDASPECARPEAGERGGEDVRARICVPGWSSRFGFTEFCRNSAKRSGTVAAMRQSIGARKCAGCPVERAGLQTKKEQGFRLAALVPRPSLRALQPTSADCARQQRGTAPEGLPPKTQTAKPSAPMLSPVPCVIPSP